MAKLKSLVLKNKHKLNESERNIIQLIISNSKEFSKLSLTELSKQLYASESAIFRVCKKIGLSGYSELKFELGEIALSQSDDTVVNKDFGFDLVGATKLIVQNFDSTDLDKLFFSLEKSEKIYIYSTGWEQEVIARYLEHELFMIGYSASVLPSALDELKQVSNFGKKNDIFFIISFSGDNKVINDEITKMELMETKFQYVSITNLKQSDLAYLAHYNLYFPALQYASNENSKSLNISFSMAYVLVDLLINKFLIWKDLHKSTEKRANNG